MDWEDEIPGGGFFIYIHTHLFMNMGLEDEIPLFFIGLKEVITCWKVGLPC